MIGEWFNMETPPADSGGVLLFVSCLLKLVSSPYNYEASKISSVFVVC